MPNWCEGVMKLRGAKDDILRFLEEGFEPSYKNSAIEIDEFGEEVNIINVNYIENTQRAFVDEQYFYIIDAGDSTIVSIKMRQAWDFSVGDFLAISEKYNLDIRLFGWERGMEFSREILIVDKNIIKDRTYRYSDWEWEVPFSDLGG